MSRDRSEVTVSRLNHNTIIVEGILQISESNGRQSFYVEGIRQYLSNQLGFYRVAISPTEYVFIKNNHGIIREVTMEQIRSAFRDSLEEIGDVRFEFEGREQTIINKLLVEQFVRNIGAVLGDKHLQLLSVNNTPILRDTKECCYLPFKERIVEITKQGVIATPYESFNEYLVWENQIIDRVFEPSVGYECHFKRFNENVMGNDDKRLNALNTATGYLLHNHSSGMNNQAVVLYDEAVTDSDTPMGGSGKGVFAEAIRQIRRQAIVDGKSLKFDSPFAFQQVERDTQVVFIDETVKGFDFTRLFSSLSTGLKVEKKGQDAFTFKKDESPKFMIASNTIMAGVGTSTERRQFLIEFSDYYSKDADSMAIVKEHGCEFYSGWDELEWQKFDNYMVKCVYKYMVNGLMKTESISVNMSRLIQTTSREFYHWLYDADQEGRLKLGEFYVRADLYKDLIDSKYEGESDLVSKKKFAVWLKAYADSRGWVHIDAQSNNSSRDRLSSFEDI